MSNRSLFSLFIQKLNENKYYLTNIFEGTALKHYTYEIFFPRNYVRMVLKMPQQEPRIYLMTFFS